MYIKVKIPTRKNELLCSNSCMFLQRAVTYKCCELFGMLDCKSYNIIYRHKKCFKAEVD